MWSIYEQNLQKRYYVPILSRGFFVAGICYIVAFIIPLLILVSIGYSWGQNSKQLLKPSMKYQNYQLFCLLSDQSTMYDSSFSDTAQQESYNSVVSVGSDKNTYSISASVQGDVLSCTVLTYNRVQVNGNYQILVTIPFNFYHQTSSTALFMNKVVQKGKIQVFSSNCLIDTAVPYSQVSYHNQNDFSMMDNSIAFSSRNLSAFVKIGTQKKTFGNSASLQFQGTFQIQSQIFIKNKSLLDKIRSITPFYIFVWLPLVFFLIIPLVQWMFSNKLYHARVNKGKINLQ